MTVNGHSEATECLLSQYGATHPLLWQCPCLIETLTVLAETSNKAAFQLAVIRSQGELSVRSYSEARKWLWKAAELGHVDAARLILDGQRIVPNHGVARNSEHHLRQRAVDLEKEGKPEAAFPVYEGLAQEGDMESQFQLADALYHGRGCKSDTLEAVRLYQAAASRGHAEAGKQLAQLGQAATKDFMEYCHRLATISVQAMPLAVHE